MRKTKKRVKTEDAPAGAPANNIGSGNIAMPVPVMGGKSDAMILRRKRAGEIKKFSSYVK